MNVSMDMATLSMIFDGGLVIAILGLWVMWYQQAGQRKKVEAMLEHAALELQQATTLLDQVMAQLPALQKQQLDAVQKPVVAKKVTQRQKVVDKVSKQDQVNIGVQKLKASLPKSKTQDANVSAQIMRLKREGLSMEAIAKHLGLPVAQVRLILLLQTSKA